MTVYSFKGTKGKTMEFQIPHPNTDWAYATVNENRYTHLHQKS